MIHPLDLSKQDVSRLSETYDDLLTSTAVSFAHRMKNEHPKYHDKRYCLFHPSFGNPAKEPVDFIIYGQALNGSWEPNFAPIDSIAPDIGQKARHWSNTITSGSDEKNPLDWVNLNWSKMSKSFFWQVAYKLVCDYCHGDRNKTDWCEKMVWSNLMKISPAEGGNPKGPEWYAQTNEAVQLFKLELEELTPKFAVLLTNWDWAAPFIQALNPEALRCDDPAALIHWSGDYGGTKVIVTHRPFPNGPSEDYVKALLTITGRCLEKPSAK